MKMKMKLSREMFKKLITAKELLGEVAWSTDDDLDEELYDKSHEIFASVVEFTNWAICNNKISRVHKLGNM